MSWGVGGSWLFGLQSWFPRAAKTWVSGNVFISRSVWLKIRSCTTSGLRMVSFQMCGESSLKRHKIEILQHDIPTLSCNLVLPSPNNEVWIWVNISHRVDSTLQQCIGWIAWEISEFSVAGFRLVIAGKPGFVLWVCRVEMHIRYVPKEAWNARPWR